MQGLRIRLFGVDFFMDRGLSFRDAQPKESPRSSSNLTSFNQTRGKAVRASAVYAEYTLLEFSGEKRHPTYHG